MASSLLLEIGVEELPSSFVDAALAALPALVRTELETLRLRHGAIHVLGTPRRLAFQVKDLEDRQPDLDEEVIGPPESAAFKDGKPTKAAEAFAAKCGIPVDALVIVAKEAAGKQKAGRYVVGRRQERGLPAGEILGPALARIAAAIPFRKSMRWGQGNVAFGRPVQWLVALLGDAVVDVTFAGARSGRTSRGHRFLAPEAFELSSADAYVEALRKRHVIVERKEREELMMGRVADAARAAGGTHDRAELLVVENASLVEEPFVVSGSFDPKFLELPPSVIRAVARGHQRYFCVEKSPTELLSTYIAVVNTANKPEVIAKGMNRVMTSRLADARFFYEEDRKATLESRVEKLGGIVFHNRLGTVREKVARIEALTAHLAGVFGLDAAEQKDAVEAAHLCKFDLASLMVGEFPELQGDMGRAYAEHAGRPARVADAVRDHYMPVGADGALAATNVANLVALTDRLDTLAGCFAVGLKPTGSADPFSLRRNCIAILRILLETPLGELAEAKSTSLQDLLRLSFRELARQGKPLDLTEDETVANVSAFAEERLRGLLGSKSSSAVADCVLGATAPEGTTHASFPRRALARAEAIFAAVQAGESWIEKAKTVGKRLAGISKEAKPHLHPGLNAKPDDAIIVKVVQEIATYTESLATKEVVSRALAAAEELARELDGVFTRTLVNDPADPKTQERLEVLSYGASRMLRLGDFSKLG